MPVYRLDSAQLEPPPEEPRTPLDCMDECTHSEACMRVYQIYVDAQEYFGWQELMAHRLHCDDCEVWDG